MTWRLRPRNNYPIWAIWPAAACEKTQGEFLFGLYFLVWGVELECSW